MQELSLQAVSQVSAGVLFTPPMNAALLVGGTLFAAQLALYANCDGCYSLLYDYGQYVATTSAGAACALGAVSTYVWLS